MVISYTKGFQNRDKYWQHLNNALTRVGEPRVFRAALCCIGDYSRIYTEEYKDQELNILRLLLRLIHENLEK
jgi:hypothetical protein